MKDPTRAPFYAAMYHGLCVTARELGYALAIHGTVTTDLDLIAVPWVDDAAPPEVLREALMKHIGALDYEGLTRRQFPDNEDLVRQIIDGEKKRQADQKIVKLPNGGEVKPHGRLAWNLYLDHGAKVDLSVLPRALDAGAKPVESPAQVSANAPAGVEPSGGSQLTSDGSSSGAALNPADRDLVLGALDSLGVALADHAHEWTDGERTIYEQACALLGRPETKPPAPSE